MRKKITYYQQTIDKVSNELDIPEKEVSMVMKYFVKGIKELIKNKNSINIFKQIIIKNKK